jgi:hypothetical protein
MYMLVNSKVNLLSVQDYTTKKHVLLQNNM